MPSGKMFTYEYVSELDEVREHIRKCEGKHIQQVVYSTFHDTITQICFVCWKVRTMINIQYDPTRETKLNNND